MPERNVSLGPLPKEAAGEFVEVRTMGKCDDDSSSGSNKNITPSFKQKRPSKLALGGIFFGLKATKNQAFLHDPRPSDQYFIENGALLSEALVASCHGNTNPIRMFSSKELTEATGNYDETRFLGEGISQVYGGIHDGRPIAVKRAFSGLFSFFLNEVVILSQINHRNVVRLLGCCIETRDPILVYEWVTRGTLHQHIHVADASCRIPWADRLRIALEVADALNYLHTALHAPIVHGNVKSSSILLDDRYSAKVCAFAFSELVPKEERRGRKPSSGSSSHANSDTVYDFGHRKTEKHDVYGFGRVLIELLTGKKSSGGRDGSHTISLVHFVSSTRENQLDRVLDERILGMANPEQVMACAWAAIRCTTEDVEERPTMKELVQELRRIRV